MMKYLIVLTGLFLWTGNALLVAQELEGAEVITLKGKKYYLHKVEKGNTLYSVSKKYNVPIEVVVDNNPGVENGLSIGRELKIPVSNHVREGQDSIAPVDSGNYIFHKVKQEETLYSIARLYQLDMKELVAENPAAAEGIEINQVLRIPVEKIKKEKPENAGKVKEEEQDDFKRHKVKKGETLYSLSKRYEITIDSIVDANDGLPEGLQKGEVIVIPVLKSGEREKVDSIPSLTKDSLRNFNDEAKFPAKRIDTLEPCRKDTYRVAVMLPFFLAINDSLEANRKVTEDPEVYGMTKIAIDFYKGLRFALDSVKEQGFSCDLHVYDTANDTAKVKEIINRPEFGNTDLIIGPLFYSSFKLAADYAKKNQIHIVSPVPQSNKILLGNPYVSKVATSSPVQVELLGKFTADSFKTENILLINHPVHIKENLLNIFRDTYKTIIDTSSDTSVYAPLQEVVWTGRLSEIKSALKAEQRNIIFVPSTNQAFVTELLTLLDPLTEEYRITVLGLERWKEYDNLDIHYLHNMNITLPSPVYINWQDSLSNSFSELFSAKYRTTPGKFAVLGFNVGYYYFSLLNRYGGNIGRHIHEYEMDLNMMSFDFFRTGLESGYENKSAAVLRYKAFQLVKVY